MLLTLLPLNYPRFAIAHATSTITAPINRLSYNIISHFNLKSENDALVEQNLQLLKERESNFLTSSDSISTAESVTTDTNTHKVTRTRLYDYSSANVVYNTIHRKYNYMMIDKGSDDGVTPDMAVLSASGIAGVVTDVTSHFATVTSLLHPNSNISAKVIPADQLGTVTWKIKSTHHSTSYNSYLLMNLQKYKLFQSIYVFIEFF